MNESFKTDPSLATSARAANESGSYLCASNVTPTAVRFIVSVFLCLLCSFHTNDMFALSEKSAEKKTKTGRLPIAHYKQKPAGSDLWPVNRCIPKINATQTDNSVKALKAAVKNASDYYDVDVCMSSAVQ